LSRCEKRHCRAKGTSHQIHTCLVYHVEFCLRSFVVHCFDSFTLRNKFFVDYTLPIKENHQHDLQTRLLKWQIFLVVPRFLRPMQRIDI
jgi:hypothetical protein